MRLTELHGIEGMSQAPSRRRFLIWLGALFLPSAAAGSNVPIAARTAEAERVYIVEGWVLTASDLEELRAHVA